MSELLTVTEVAKIIGVHPSTVRRWIRIGELPAIKIGGSVRVRRSVLEWKLKGGDRCQP